MDAMDAICGFAPDARGKKRPLDETENSSSSGSSMEEDTDEGLSSESESEDMVKVVSGIKPSARTMGWRNKINFKLTLEVFSVQFIDRNPVNKLEEMYGEIVLSWGFDRYALFERLPGDPPPIIDAEGFLAFSGPKICLLAYDRIELVVCLSRLEETPNPIYQYAMWNSNWYHYPDLCDKLLSNKLETPFGLVQIDYAVFYRAAPSFLEVKLLDWKDEGKHNGTRTEIEVFGSVIARTKLITDDRARSYMFHRDENMCALVRPGEAIPLSKRIICFPYASRVVVDVNLCLRRRSDNDSSLGGVDSMKDSIAVSARPSYVEFKSTVEICKPPASFNQGFSKSLLAYNSRSPTTSPRFKTGFK